MTLLNVAKEIHSTLDEFLKIQEQGTGQSGFIGAIKNLFRKIDFNGLCTQAKTLDNNLQSRVDLLNGYYTSDPDEVALRTVLIHYATALQIAIQKYIIINTNLAEKAQGKELPWSHYSRLLDEFKEAEQGYLAFGLQLNMCYKKVAQKLNPSR